MRCGAQKFQIVTAVLIDEDDRQRVLIDHGAKFLGHVAEADWDVNRNCRRITSGTHRRSGAQDDVPVQSLV